MDHGHPEVKSRSFRNAAASPAPLGPRLRCDVGPFVAVFRSIAAQEIFALFAAVAAF